MFRHLDLAFWRAQNHLGSQVLFVHAKNLPKFSCTSSVCDASQNVRSSILAFYSRIHEEHWLRDKLEEGRIVILEDESIWEVHPWDRQITKRWLRISTITVKHTEKEGYPYLLSNSTEGEDARVNYLGESARM